MKFKELYALLTNAEKIKSAVNLLSENSEYRDIVAGDLQKLKDLQQRVFLRLKDQAATIAQAYSDKLVKNVAEMQQEVNAILGQGKDQYELMADTDYVEKANKLSDLKDQALAVFNKAGTSGTNWDLVDMFTKQVSNPQNGQAGLNFLAKGLLMPGNEGNVLGTLGEYEKLNIKEVLDFYVEIAGEEFLDKTFENLQNDLSFATETYVKEGKMDDELIKGYMPKTNGDVPLVGGSTQQYADTVNKGVEADARKLKDMLGGLTVADGPAYERRLQSIAQAAISAKDKDQIFTFTGTNQGAYRNTEFGVQYLKELMLKSDAFKDSRALYTNGLDFNKLKKDAVERFAGVIISSKDARDTARKWRLEGQKFADDKEVIDRAFANCNNADDFNKAFNKLVLDTIDKNSIISKFEENNLVRRPKDIAKVSSYIYNMYQYQRNDRNLSDFGITPDTINAKCAQLANTSVTTNAYLNEFNTKLNLYKVEGAELRALNLHTFVPNPTDPVDINMNKNLLRAQAKTEGLVCNSTDPILDDAIFTYSQLKDIHSARPWYFKFIHPFVNYAEGNAVEKMEETLGAKFDLRGVELETRINEIKESGQFHTAGELAALKVGNKEAYKAAMALNKARKTERDNIINKQLENINKYGTRVKPQEEVEKEHEVIKPVGNKIHPTFVLENDDVVDKEIKIEDMGSLIQRIKSSADMLTEINFSKNQDELAADASLTEQDVKNYIMSNKKLNKRYTKLLEDQANASNKEGASKEEIENAQKKFEQGYKDLDTEVRKRYTLQKQVLKEQTTDIEVFIDEEGFEKDQISATTSGKEELDEMLAIDKAKYPEMFLSKEDQKDPEKVNEAKSKALSPEEIKELEDTHEYNQKIRGYNKECREYNKQSRLNQFWDKFDEFKKNNPETDVSFLEDVEPDKKERDITLANMQKNIDAHKKQIQDMVDKKDEVKDIDKKQVELNKQLNKEIGNNINNINNDIQPKQEVKNVNKDIIIEENTKIEDPSIGNLKK